MLRNVAVDGVPGVGARSGRIAAEPAKVRWLIGLTCAGWGLVATMRYWWSWLWDRLGVASVPVDTLVWIVALILTILVTPVLWRRYQHVWVIVVFAVATLCIGGTVIVLAPWQHVLTNAWLRDECGQGNCSAPQPLPAYHWRIEKPK
jgi:hypothetical protein